MKLSKVIEGIGFTMLIVAFVLHLLGRLNYMNSAENFKEYLGLAGMAIWAFAYGYNAQKKTEDNT